METPLVVDLDGTLLKTDLLLESANRFVVGSPFAVWQFVPWLFAGRAAFKSRLAHGAQVDASSLPYDERIVSWLRECKSQGREVVLATATHERLANQVAAHLGVFDSVIATTDKANLKGGAKRDALVARFGEGGYEYIGDHAADVDVWKSASKAHVVSDSASLVSQVGNQGNLGRVFSSTRPSTFAGLLKAMRPHQWLKNLLVFVPLLAAHRYGAGESVVQAAIAFIAFGLAASSVYLLNDLVDVEADRHHPRKRLRPFASGDTSLLAGWIAWPLLLAAAMVLSLALLPIAFAACLATYVVASAAYSFRLKQVPVVDVLALAALYTLRIIAGAAAISVALSFWLLAFSMFVFLSLAFIKRYSELKAARDADVDTTPRGRGYHAGDLEIISSLGTGSGMVAVLVLALYIQDAHTASMYGQPRFIWLACPLLLYWIARAWLFAHRGQMHDDPLVFALKDRVSWLVIALLAAVFVLARVMP